MVLRDMIPGRQLVRLATLLAGAGLCAGNPSRGNVPPIFNNNNFAPVKTVERDVAIIGGGATGTYAAVRLRDLNQSFIVIECQDQLGGHTQTYRDPRSGNTTDIGVEIYSPLNVTKDFFGRFNVSLVNFSSGAISQGHQNADAETVTEQFDFQTGQNLTGLSDPGQNETASALQAFKAQMDRYPYVNTGGFYLEYPVPSDLLMRFSDFVEKYNLGPAVRTLYNYGQGLGDFLDQLTLYVFKSFGPIDVDNLLNSRFLTSAHNDNAEVYRKAYAWLGQKDVWLQSTVLATDRDISMTNLTMQGKNCSETHPLRLLVKTPDGNQLIYAKKILLTIPPKLGNLDGWDLDSEEFSLFSQLRNSAFYTGVLNNTGLSPPNTIFQNAANGTSYNIQKFPGIYSLNPALGIPGAFNVKYGSPVPLSLDAVKADILSSVRRLPRNDTSLDPDFLIFESHTPFEMVVDAEAIANGYYERLNALQGRNNMFYTGATFDTQDSALLWQFTEEKVLPQLMASLEGN